jgi:hypothetical protein
MNTSLWYAEGLRWIGSLFNGAAAHFERAAATAAQLDPRRCTQEDYLSDVRHRVHTHF